MGGTKRAEAASAAPGSRDGDPILALRSVDAWEAWLRANHDRSAGVLLRIPKKGASDSTLTYAAALEIALAWGWIDGQKRALDDAAWLQRFTRRTRRSPWSKLNRARAEALIASGQMQEPGLAEVDRAKRDGRWERAYDGARASTVPDDLAEALDRNPRARAFFEALDAANRYAILYRVTTAKLPETRANRIATFVAMCAAHRTLHPARAKTAKARSRASGGPRPSLPVMGRSMVRIKRAYDAPARDDGHRVLVDRLWPRGVTKQQLRLDAWAKELAPAPELRKWFGHDPARFPEFTRRYQAELRREPARSLLAALVGRAAHGPVTLVYGARDELHNGAVVLRDLIQDALRAHA